MRGLKDMKVKELRKKLKEYNQDADVDVIVYNRQQNFSLCFGGCDGGTKLTADSVSFYVDELCQSEVVNNEKG
jgi:hypothetical protein